MEIFADPIYRCDRYGWDLTLFVAKGWLELINLELFADKAEKSLPKPVGTFLTQDSIQVYWLFFDISTRSNG